MDVSSIVLVILQCWGNRERTLERVVCFSLPRPLSGKSETLRFGVHRKIKILPSLYLEILGLPGPLIIFILYYYKFRVDRTKWKQLVLPVSALVCVVRDATAI